MTLRQCIEEGVAVGGFTAILLALSIELIGSRPNLFEAECAIDAFPEVREILPSYVAKCALGDAMTDRPAYVGDETVLAVVRKVEDGTRRPRRLRATARMYGNTARLEFAASIGDEKFENRFALHGEGSGETTLERNVSLWMLRRPASTVRRNLSTS